MPRRGGSTAWAACSARAAGVHNWHSVGASGPGLREPAAAQHDTTPRPLEASARRAHLSHAVDARRTRWAHLPGTCRRKFSPESHLGRVGTAREQVCKNFGSKAAARQRNSPCFINRTSAWPHGNNLLHLSAEARVRRPARVSAGSGGVPTKIFKLGKRQTTHVDAEGLLHRARAEAPWLGRCVQNAAQRALRARRIGTASSFRQVRGCAPPETGGAACRYASARSVPATLHSRILTQRMN